MKWKQSINKNKSKKKEWNDGKIIILRMKRKKNKKVEK